MVITKIPLAALTPDPHNAKDHPTEQIEQIKNSIEQFGNNDPIAVWGEQNLIVEGHGRFEALKALGYTEAECIRLDQLTDEERRAYALAHNQTTMSSGWLPEELDWNLGSIGDIDMSAFGFVPETDGEVTEDNYDPDIEQPEPVTQPGDLFALGAHRLLCGDSTKPDDFARLMGGKEADLVITDPPYGVAYEADIAPEDRKKLRRSTTRSNLQIKNDTLREDNLVEFLIISFNGFSAHLKRGGGLLYMDPVRKNRDRV